MSQQRPSWLLRLLDDLTQVDIRNLDGQVNESQSLEGEGSYGRVYKGIYNDQYVCVKILKEVRIEDNQSVITKFCRRMMREVKVWAGLTHPNVVAFHGWILECPQGENVIRAKLVSLWCEGGTVLAYLKRHPRTDRRGLVVDICEGLTYLHSQDVVHGDIKPENAVVDGNGIVMLCDFGLSSILYEEATYAQATSLTGTLRFTAPELVDGIDRRNKASDVWAFGCTAGQILLDKKPHHLIRNEYDVLHALGQGFPPHIWNNPDKFEASIGRCLTRDPEERPTIIEVVEGFREEYQPRIISPGAERREDSLPLMTTRSASIAETVSSLRSDSITVAVPDGPNPDEEAEKPVRTVSPTSASTPRVHPSNNIFINQKDHITGIWTIDTNIQSQHSAQKPKSNLSLFSPSGIKADIQVVAKNGGQRPPAVMDIGTKSKKAIIRISSRDYQRIRLSVTSEQADVYLALPDDFRGHITYTMEKAQKPKNSFSCAIMDKWKMLESGSFAYGPVSGTIGEVEEEEEADFVNVAAMNRTLYLSYHSQHFGTNPFTWGFSQGKEQSERGE